MTKLLTLCIAVYNMDKYLDRCLSSLVMGDDRLMSQLEVLVISDGSTDGSCGIARSYENRWPDTFRLIEKANGQYGSCVNLAIREGQGRYFRMLDADDWFNTSALEQLLRDIENGIEADLLVTKFTRYTKFGTISHRGDPVRLTYGREYAVEEMVTFMRDVWPSSYVMHNMTYRLDFLRQMGLRLTEGIYFSDTEYCFYPLYHLHSVVYLDIDLYQYDVSRDGQTTQLDVAYRNRRQLLLLVTQCVSHYLKERDRHTAEFNQMARLLLMFLIKALYMSTCLGHCVDDGGEDHSMLLQTDELLRREPALYCLTNERRYNFLPYVKLVRSTGCWPYMGLWGCYNRTMDFMKRMVGYANKSYE